MIVERSTSNRSAASEMVVSPPHPAHRLLGWLGQRDHTLAQATQADLDAWHATHRDHQRRTLRTFLRWAMATGHLPRLELPRLFITRAADGGVFIRFGQPPTPAPEPFATLLLQAEAQRDNLQTATSPAARWPVPGRRAGQPLHASTLAALVRDLGVAALAGRTAAPRESRSQAAAVADLVDDDSQDLERPLGAVRCPAGPLVEAARPIVARQDPQHDVGEAKPGQCLVRGVEQRPPGAAAPVVRVDVDGVQLPVPGGLLGGANHRKTHHGLVLLGNQHRSVAAVTCQSAGPSLGTVLGP
jgi:hypothetical protein